MNIGRVARERMNVSEVTFRVTGDDDTEIRLVLGSQERSARSYRGMAVG